MPNRPIDPDRLAVRFARLAVAAALDEDDPQGWPDRRRIIGRAVARSISHDQSARITRFLDRARTPVRDLPVEDPQQVLTREFLALLQQLDHLGLSKVARSIDLMAVELPRSIPRHSASRGFVSLLDGSERRVQASGGSHAESDAYRVEDVEAAADSLHLALARLFIRLGPPPDLTEGDFAPLAGDDGGVRA
ncbi:hypothetical protein J3A78_007615 [Streptomyces sp. PvR006]|uniref:hypothetical protein n=1 Tax=unclassified Streptomyces TaxID=2593676 RepID=UPI001AE7B999|nr:hypothetical protein [Streptomyces sp. PvR006]MBP2587137.1 hypothetical protein [Streptomyces sp. PvR006]